MNANEAKALTPWTILYTPDGERFTVVEHTIFQGNPVVMTRDEEGMNVFFAYDKCENIITADQHKARR